jgi:hypothetical protein
MIGEQFEVMFLNYLHRLRAGYVRIVPDAFEFIE